jgi:ankyrin repeat protein
MYGSVDVISLPLERGADVRALDAQGQTPLQSAEFYRRCGEEAIASMTRKNRSDLPDAPAGAGSKCL